MLRGPNRRYGANMQILLRTNDLVLLGFVQSLLSDAGIHAVIFDEQMSAMEGSVGILPRRLMVADDDFAAAEALMKAMNETTRDAR